MYISIRIFFKHIFKRFCAALVFALVASLLMGADAEKMGKEKSRIAYLHEYHSAVDLGKGTLESQFSLLEADLADNVVFFTAENHGVNGNYVLRIAFLKYFKQKTDFRYILAEMPHSGAHRLNQYLETTNETILDDYYKSLKGTFVWSREGYDYWKDVCEFNKSLPQDRKLTVVGVDLEFQWDVALQYIHAAMSNTKPPSETKPILKELNSLLEEERPVGHKVKSFADRLKHSMTNKEAIHRRIFGDRYFDICLVTDNILATFQARKNVKRFNQLRDKQMFENFLRIYPIIEKGKFYDQWGLSHAFQSSQAGVKWFAANLAKDNRSPVKGKVLSIVYIYKNCKFMLRNRRKGTYSVQNLDTSGSDATVFQEYLTTRFTLFRLNGQNSPYNTKLIWPFIGEQWGLGPPAQGVTTDYFQYLLVIKDSLANTPMYGNLSTHSETKG